MATPPQTIFLTGATGLLGTRLAAGWASSGQSVRALCRRSQPADAKPGIEWVCGDVTREGDWRSAVDGADVVVHLAGEPVASKRWTRARKAALRASRILGTRQLVEAMAAAQRPPSVLVCASAAGYYGARGESELDEASPPGNDFLAELAVGWEVAAQAAEQAGTRVVLLRFGTILSRSGGALPRMLPLFRVGLGGPMGPAANFVPWIHEQDATGLVNWALARDELSGAVNAVSPGAVRMGEFARELGRAIGRPAILPVPVPLLKLVMGELGGALFPGQRIRPRVALERDYAFRFEDIRSALASLFA